MFWEAIMVIVVVSIVMTAVVRIVKMALRHSENVERIKKGYPTLDGSLPAHHTTEVYTESAAHYQN